MLTRVIHWLVGWSTRGAAAVFAAGILAAALCSLYAAEHLKINTDTADLISPSLSWRQRDAELDRAFPQNVDQLAIVVDGATSGLAEDGAAALARWALQHPDLFKGVQQPGGGEFFKHNGLLFLSAKEVQDVADQLIAAQPMLGALAADPSLRGLFSSISLATEGVKHGDIAVTALNAPLTTLADTTEAVLAGKAPHLSWDSLLTGRTPHPEELRRFVLVQPVLDYSALQPGARASQALRTEAEQLGLTPDHGVRVRLTGSVALSDEEFASVRQGAAGTTILSLALVCLMLFLALRSWRLILAIVVTLLVGLAVTSAFAAAAVGALNLISIAFAVLFIGIAVDFSIQFSVRYRDERHHVGDLSQSINRAGLGIGGSLALAAGATAVGFFAFVPTDYSGVSELGLIAGTSMIIAFILNLTMLPATLKLLRPPGEAEPVGYAWAAGIDDFLLHHRRSVIGVAAVAAVLGVILLPQWRFDFDPLNLKDPHSESMSTLFDLMKDPSTTPYTIDILMPSIDEADARAALLEKLSDVAQVVTVSSFVPDQQPEKLAILSDAALLLGPTLSPLQVAPPPDDAANLATIAACAHNLRDISGLGAGNPAARLASLLEEVGHRGAAVLPQLNESIVSELRRRLDDLRASLAAEPVTMANLPDELRRDWVASDGRARIQVFPKGDARDHEILLRFVAAVRAIAPEATGSPVTILESGNTVVGAFIRAGWIAVVAITLLLLAMLRSVRDVALVLAPLLLAGLLTAATSVLAGLPLNYANIIALPLLLGIGVAFDIYFVMRWRAGLAGPLQSSTARAVLFSALTTATAFGSLALSSHPGTAEMGRLLTMSLFYTLVCTLFVLPALQGPVRR